MSINSTALSALHSLNLFQMSTFTRIAGFALLMLSLSYLVSAIPTPSINVKIPAINGTDAISCVLAKFMLDIEAKIHALGKS